MTKFELQKPNIVISSCLLGNPVRYNGGHKKEDWITKVLSKFVNYIPVCPEVAMGMGIPRPPVHLVKRAGEIYMIEVDSRKDWTTRAKNTANEICEKLKLNEIDGVILQRSSPSCAPFRVKTYNDNNDILAPDKGIFAKTYIENFPYSAIIDEGRINNAEFKEHFVTQLFINFKVRQLKPNIKDIQYFHQRHKYLTLSYNPKSYSELGRIAANSEKKDVKEVLNVFKEILQRTYTEQPTRNKRFNSIQHIYGFFKNQMGQSEKRHFLDNLEQYKLGYLSFSSILILLESFVRRYDDEYLDKQYFFQAHPKELRLNSEI